MKTIIDKIKALNAKEKRVIVGIDGLGGAGKSTVSEDIKDTLEQDGIPVLLLHIDDFIHPRAVRYNGNYEEWECYYNLQWRYDYLIENVLSPIKENEDFSTSIELYDKDNDTYTSQEITVSDGSVVIIEGIFLQRPELDGVFNYMIYIDVPEEERLMRVLKRDGYIGDEKQIEEKYNNRYFPAERYYASRYQPSEKADTVIGIKE